MFEKAARLKLRFDSPRGPLTTEDLFDLPLTSTRVNVPCLDAIAIGINKQIKDTTTESFVNETTKADDELQLKLDIVKHVIAVKKAENAEAKAAADRRAQKARIMELIGKKKDEELAGKSVEELQSLLASL